MEENEVKKKRGRKRRNAMQPSDPAVKTESEEKEEAKTKVERVCAPADYKIMEELIVDPVSEEKERRRRAIEKWTEESHAEFANGLATHGKRFRKLADPLPDITVADCVEHYYMTKPFYFNFEEWKAYEKAKDAGLQPSSKGSEGPFSDGAQTSSASEPQSSSSVCELLEGTRIEKLKKSEETDVIKID